jgi:hypothetical protein
MLRGARMHSAVRAVSFLVPLDERPSRIRHPKRPSTVHRPMSELRSRYVNKRQRNVRDPKISSATRRPTSEPRVEPLSETPARIQAPKSPSPSPRFTSKRLETVCQESTPRPSSEELFSDESPRPSAPGGTFQRAPEPHQASEETVNETSARLPAPWNLPPSFSTFQGSEEPVHEASACHRDPWGLPASVRAASKLRRTFQRNIGSRSSSAGPSAEHQTCVKPPKRPSTGRQPVFQLRVECITELQNRIQAPKNLSATHRPESAAPGISSSHH